MMRYVTKKVDARRVAKPMVIPLARRATPQEFFCDVTRRDDHALRAWRCCSPLAWNDQAAWFAPSHARKAWPSHSRFLLIQAPK